MTRGRRDRRFDVLRPGQAAKVSARELRRDRRRAAAAMLEGPSAAPRAAPGAADDQGAAPAPQPSPQGLAAAPRAPEETCP